MEKIPLDCFSEIVEFVGDVGSVHSLLLTKKVFKEQIEQVRPSSCSRLCFEFKKAPTEKKLFAWKVSFSKKTGYEIGTMIQYFPNLQTLKLHNCVVVDSQIFLKLEKLEWLYIEWSDKLRNECKNEHLKSLKNLKSLSLVYRPWYNKEGVGSLFTCGCLTFLPSLEKLKIDQNTDLTESSASFFKKNGLKDVSISRKLRKLVVSDSLAFTNEDFIHFPKSLKRLEFCRCRNLRGKDFWSHFDELEELSVLWCYEAPPMDKKEMMKKREARRKELEKKIGKLPKAVLKEDQNKQTNYPTGSFGMPGGMPGMPGWFPPGFPGPVGFPGGMPLGVDDTEGEQTQRMKKEMREHLSERSKLSLKKLIMAPYSSLMMDMVD